MKHGVVTTAQDGDRQAHPGVIWTYTHRKTLPSLDPKLPGVSYGGSATTIEILEPPCWSLVSTIYLSMCTYLRIQEAAVFRRWQKLATWTLGMRNVGYMTYSECMLTIDSHWQRLALLSNVSLVSSCPFPFYLATAPLLWRSRKPLHSSQGMLWVDDYLRCPHTDVGDVTTSKDYPVTTQKMED
ncbi:hypothetical protein BC826DRAFT_195098 [Russula brevipes]|nr:hypothetical protein BC826DRAFT_195098 [Russula brevipes]